MQGGARVQGPLRDQDEVPVQRGRAAAAAEVEMSPPAPAQEAVPAAEDPTVPSRRPLRNSQVRRKGGRARAAADDILC